MKKKIIRKKEIESKLVGILDSINSIDEKLPDDFKEFESMGFVKDGIYKRIEFSIENVVSICSIMNSDLRLGMPETEEDILDHLEKEKVFSKRFVSLVREMKKFRNILVHRYGEINDETAFKEIKSGLKDFEIVIKEIEKVLKKF